MSDLPAKEMSERLTSYESEETTKELYDFGKMLVQECVERVHHIDSKATMLAGYSGTILALLVATSAIWKPTIDKWAMGIVFAAAFAALMAGMFAIWSFSPTRFDWFSDNEWVDKAYLNDPEQLRRYHVLTMHNVVSLHEAISKLKTARIKSSRFMLGISATLLFAALANAVLKGGV